MDSLATPLAGWVLDYFGHRRIWHFGGTIAVSIGFCLIFSLDPVTFSMAVFVYYMLAITLFQVGWAMVQISHLSIIPEISTSHTHSSELTAIRYTASVCCSISVYLITLIILGNDGETEVIGPSDFYKFKEIALIITFIGLLSSMLFYCGLLGTYENEYEVIREADPEDMKQPSNQIGKHVLRSCVIYLVSIMYMTSRLFTTLNLIYMPLYIDERGSFNVENKERMRQTIASVPLVSYIASFLTAIFLKFRLRILTDKVTYFLGSLCGLMASVWIGIGISAVLDAELYIIAISIGISSSSTMVSSLCITANFVKRNGYGGGLVYSVVTFTDKLISGLVVLIVQNLQCSPRSLCPNFYKNVLTYIGAVVSILGLLSLALLQYHLKKNVLKMKPETGH
ncbi:unnamed protein product [Phaedon cochleariae]|uniref:Major facilitator superfamily domain-containing protein 12-like n=1 Tax=Phaedon cochleariae TaxID=80249 RepID=A0A9P0DCK9_PHACE|nr:unnamed protein product [Phaedon cochleariae]